MPANNRYNDRFYCDIKMRYLLLIMLVISHVGEGRTRLTSSLSDLQVINHGRLQRFWAQHAIGVPEGHAFLSGLAKHGWHFHRTKVGVLDTGFYLFPSPRVRFSSVVDQQVDSDIQERILLAGLPEEVTRMMRAMFWAPPRDFLRNHGTMVIHLIAGESPVGVSVNSEIDLLITELQSHPFADDSEVVTANVNYYQMVANMGGSLPEIINLSVFIGGREEAVPLAQIAEQSIVIISAGNSFPSPLELGIQELSSEVIVVGGTAPDGRVSDFSPRTDSEVTTLAPSDHCILSCGFDSKLSQASFMVFGGTSGAAPLVSGTIADTISLLPGLLAAEARYMIAETAIRTDKNPTGSLNYYKMLRVAGRLVEAGWPAERHLIFTEAIYDFTAEARQLLEQSHPSSTMLRRSFFLDDNDTIRQILGKLYQDVGYRAESEFYGN